LIFTASDSSLPGSLNHNPKIEKGITMSTRIEIEYDRIYTDADAQAILSRAAASLNVLQQLGVAYQTLPGYEMAGYQTEADAMEVVVNDINALINQIRPKLIALDAMARPLDEKNKGLLRTLDGLLKTAAQRALLAQITGPTAEGGGSTPPPAPTP
jgi:hypothetical protein